MRLETGPAITIIERCSGELRTVPSMQTHRKKLQQAWEVTQYRDGAAWKQYTEWRDVPHVDDPQ